MRENFEVQLANLNTAMVEMGSLCKDAIHYATSYLADRDEDRKGLVTDLVEQINHKEREIEDMCLKLIMTQQPVAKDLRIITAALKMVSDLERIGDNADDIVEIVSMDNITKEDIDDAELGRMSQASSKMLSDAIDAFVERDEKLARKVIEDDDIVDGLFDNTKKKLAQAFIKNSEKADTLLDLLMVSKYYERIADHSVNVGQWVVFMETGKLEGNTN